MIDNILALGPPRVLELLTILVALAILSVLTIVFRRLLVRNKRENIRLRLEVGKLANELEQARKQKGTEGGDSSTES